MSHDVRLVGSHNVRLSGRHDSTNLLYCTISQPRENTEFVPKFTIVLTHG